MQANSSAIAAIPRATQSSGYVGRFAPSPTGQLHFGSLLAAVASFLQAKATQGQWLVRIEDLDTPRVVPGAADDILRTLAAFGFEWDGPAYYQSQRLDLYADALTQLNRNHHVYACSCSRSQIAAQASGAPIDLEELRYPGTCRHRNSAPSAQTALRFVVPQGIVTFVDAIQGAQSQDVAASIGDFVIRRRDQIYAYHLAVVVDDAAQSITEVVRGADLLGSTARHMLLQMALAYPVPAYAHIPLAIDLMGQKLSKSSQSLPISRDGAAPVLWSALQALCQSPPIELIDGPLNELWAWALKHWSLDVMAGHPTCPAPPPGKV